MGFIETNTRRVAGIDEALATDDGGAQDSSTMPIPKGRRVPRSKIVRYVKNINPKEIVTFNDGTTFRFPSSLYVCDDAEMIAKIDQVANRYNIVTQ